MDDAQKGAKALDNSDFPAAIKWYTKALTVNPHATDYYIKRSTAYSRVKPEDGGPKLQEALHDADMAVALGIQRARREQIIAGQMRRGIVLYQSERYGDAELIFQLVRAKVGQEDDSKKGDLRAALASHENPTASQDKKTRQQLQIWEMKVKSQMAKLESSDEKTKVVVKEIPDIKVPTQDELKATYRAQLENGGAPSIPDSSGLSSTQEKDTAAEANPAPSTANPPPTPLPSNTLSRTRHEWYQSNDSVVITIYAKGVPKDKADVDIQETSVSIQ